MTTQTKIDQVKASPEYVALEAEHARLGAQYRALNSCNVGETNGMKALIARQVEIGARIRQMMGA